LSSKWEKEIDIVQSLNNLTTHLKKWNKETFGDIFKRKKEILSRLNGIQNSSNYGYSTFLENLGVAKSSCCHPLSGRVSLVSKI
jgi:CRISPR/Cas system-associated endonuclease Cas3-HD